MNLGAYIPVTLGDVFGVDQKLFSALCREFEDNLGRFEDARGISGTLYEFWGNFGGI